MKKRETLAARLGQRIRQLRRDGGLTQAQLAAKAGINVKYVTELENGHRDVRLSTLGRVGKALKVDTADLFRFAEADRTATAIERMLHGRDEVFRERAVRLLHDALLLADTGRA